jgi:hypothetical protein
VRQQSIPRGQTDQNLSGIVDTDAGGGQYVAQCIGQQLSAAIPPDADQAIGCSQIYANDHVSTVDRQSANAPAYSKRAGARLEWPPSAADFVCIIDPFLGS